MAQKRVTEAFATLLPQTLPPPGTATRMLLPDRGIYTRRLGWSEGRTPFTNRLEDVGDVEVRERLASALEVCEHEADALDALRDDRVSAVLQAMSTLRAEIVSALAALTQN
jgi:hypothetical protein